MFWRWQERVKNCNNLIQIKKNRNFQQVVDWLTLRHTVSRYLSSNLISGCCSANSRQHFKNKPSDIRLTITFLKSAFSSLFFFFEYVARRVDKVYSHNICFVNSSDFMSSIGFGMIKCKFSHASGSFFCNQFDALNDSWDYLQNQFYVISKRTASTVLLLNKRWVNSLRGVYMIILTTDIVNSTVILKDKNNLVLDAAVFAFCVFTNRHNIDIFIQSFVTLDWTAGSNISIQVKGS